LNGDDALLEAIVDEIKKLKAEVHGLRSRIDGIQERISRLELKRTTHDDIVK